MPCNYIIQASIIRAQNLLTPPKELVTLSAEINDAARTADALFGNEQNMRKQIYDDLLATADAGLRGPNYSLEAGRANLDEVKKSIASRFPIIRNRLWKQYLKFLIILFLIFGTLGAVIYYESTVGAHEIPAPDNKGNFDQLVALAIAFFWIPVGVALGIFLEFCFPNRRQGLYIR